jgi:hypothetical protein
MFFGAVKVVPRSVERVNKISKAPKGPSFQKTLMFPRPSTATRDSPDPPAVLDTFLGGEKI